MLLTEIASFINIAGNNQLSPEQVVLIIDNVQKTAFQKNTAAFLQYRQKLIPRQIFTLSASGFTACEDSDIGKSVAHGTGSGAGTLVSFDNDARTWVVESTTKFSANQDVGINDGEGSGTLTAVETFKGPYAAPTSPECRKVWGITQRKPERFWLDFIGICGLYWINGLPNSNDFLAFWGPIAPFETGLNDDLTNEFTFSFDPSFEATYYWVYWRNPPTITGLDDSTQLIIPEAYHLQLIQACNAAAASLLSGEPYDDSTVERYLGGWIDSLRAPFREQKLNQNMTQGGQNTFGWGVGGYQGGYGGNLL